MRNLVPLLIVFALNSCELDDAGSTCQADFECQGLCSRASTCVAIDQAIDIRLSWTVAGQSPTPLDATSCGPILNLEVNFETNSARQTGFGFFPVPCQLGKTFYDRMPDNIILVQVRAFDADGNLLDERSQAVTEQSSEIQLDLLP